MLNIERLPHRWRIRDGNGRTVFLLFDYRLVRIARRIANYCARHRAECDNWQIENWSADTGWRPLNQAEWKIIGQWIQQASR